jgi:glycine betaine/proline transport system substrate-binding protein
MLSRISDRISQVILGFIMALCLVATAAQARAEPAAIRIGWTAWSDAEFVTKLAARLIETRLGRDVDLVLVDIALQYQGVARGDLDAMLMAWLPKTHADYQARFGADLVDLGPLYTGAWLGWVVPKYVPANELATMADLAKPSVARRLNHQIYGIDPGAGLTRLSEEALETYGLERYNLIMSSGAAMTAMIERAERRKKWIVTTGWRPHWMFQEWDLRFLEDPKGALGGDEEVHALVRRGLERDAPDVVAMLRRMRLPLDQLEAAMALARRKSYDYAVDRYIELNPRSVRYWLTGKKK